MYITIVHFSAIKIIHCYIHTLYYLCCTISINSITQFTLHGNKKTYNHKTDKKDILDPY